MMGVRNALRPFAARAVQRHAWLRYLVKWDTWAYLRNRLRGRPYAEYYAARMARFATRDQDGGCGGLADRRWQYEFCRAKGIVGPDAHFLDYGCGAGAAGVPFIEFLPASHYTGADITAAYLEIARQRVANLGLAHKQPRYIHVPAGDMAALEGLRFDVAWSQSVLNHMPAADQARVIASILGLLNRGGAYYATVLVDEKPRHTHHLNFWLPSAAYREMAAAAAGKVERVEGWTHPHATEGELLRFWR